MSRFISDYEDTTTTDGKTITAKYIEPKNEIRKEVYVAQENINEIADAVAKKLQPKAQMTVSLDCSFCRQHECGDTLYESSDWDGGIGFDYIRDIRFCPICGRELCGARMEE